MRTGGRHHFGGRKPASVEEADSCRHELGGDDISGGGSGAASRAGVGDGVVAAGDVRSCGSVGRGRKSG
jgi:hypothetical protein